MDRTITENWPTRFVRACLLYTSITVSTLGEKGRAVAGWLNDMSLVFYKMVALLMKLAPIGLMAYFANLTGIYGPDLLKSYGRGLLIYYPAAILYFFVFLGLYAFIAAGTWGVKNFFKNILTPALTALGTRSSACLLYTSAEILGALRQPPHLLQGIAVAGDYLHGDHTGLLQRL